MVRYLEYVRLERSNNSAGCSINPFVVDRRFDGYEEIVAMVKNERWGGGINNIADTFELSMQFRIITEYVAPNYENVYPDDITKYMEPISWEAHFGESYFITITGDKISGYKADLAE